MSKHGPFGQGVHEKIGANIQVGLGLMFITQKIYGSIIAYLENIRRDNVASFQDKVM